MSLLHRHALAAAVALGVTVAPGGPARAQSSTGAVSLGSTDIGGIVTGPNGPEAGVWVIAETTDLPTRYSKIVVTDDQGRYLIPDLPAAGYQVWVRGYGLVDSPRVAGTPGQALNLTARSAPSAADAAEAYPGMYWYSMLRIPASDQFPGTGDAPGGNRISPLMRTQQAWVDTVLQSCHPATRWAVRTCAAPARR